MIHCTQTSGPASVHGRAPARPEDPGSQASPARLHPRIPLALKTERMAWCPEDFVEQGTPPACILSALCAFFMAPCWSTGPEKPMPFTHLSAEWGQRLPGPLFCRQHRRGQSPAPLQPGPAQNTLGLQASVPKLLPEGLWSPSRSGPCRRRGWCGLQREGHQWDGRESRA